MNNEQPFLGKGWSFPPSFDNHSGKIEMVTEEQDIIESLQLLLSTRPGERIMQHNYGCNLDVMLYEPITTTLITYVEDLIRTSIVYHEPRIELNRIKIRTDNAIEGYIHIELAYTVLSFNSRFNLVFPYYLEEGSAGDAKFIDGNSSFFQNP